MTRRFRFERSHGFWSINGKIYEEDRIDARPRAGDVEIWEFTNNSGGWIHPVHVHLVNFKILQKNGRPPAPHETGWKDTVYLGPNQTARVLMRCPSGRTPAPSPAGTSSTAISSSTRTTT